MQKNPERKARPSQRHVDISKFQKQNPRPRGGIGSKASSPTSHIFTYTNHTKAESKVKYAFHIDLQTKNLLRKEASSPTSHIFTYTNHTKAKNKVKYTFHVDLQTKNPLHKEASDPRPPPLPLTYSFNKAYQGRQQSQAHITLRFTNQKPSP